MLRKKFLSELKNVIQDRDKRKTGRNEEDRLDGERDERREEKDAVVDHQWDDVMGSGKPCGKTYREVYRNDRQHCDWINSVNSTDKGLTEVQIDISVHLVLVCHRVTCSHAPTQLCCSRSYCRVPRAASPQN